MIRSFVALADLGRMHVQPYHRAAWFVLGCLQREHALNMKAFLASPPGAVFAAWMTALHAAAGLHPALGEPQPGGRRGSSRSQ